MNDTIDSGTTAFLTVAFEDRDGNPTTPTSVYFALRALVPSKLLRTETQVANPASSMEIMITALENTMIGRADQETRRATVRAVYGPNDEFVTHTDYTLQRAT